MPLPNALYTRQKGIATFIIAAGQNVTGIVSPGVLLALGGTPALIGVAKGLYESSYALGNLPAAKLGLRVGASGLIRLGLLGTAISAALFSTSTALLFAIIALVLLRLCTAMFDLGINTTAAAAPTRAFALGTVERHNHLGYATGSALVASLLVFITFQQALWLWVAACFLVASLYTPSSFTSLNKPALGWLATWKTYTLPVSVAVLAGFLAGTRDLLAPLELASLGVALTAVIGMYAGVTLFVALLIRAFVQRSTHTLVVYGTLLCVIGMLLPWLLGTSLLSWGLAVALSSLGQTGILVCARLLGTRSSADTFSYGLATVALTFAIAKGAGAFAAGLALSLTSSVNAFAVFGVLGLLSAILIWRFAHAHAA